jgi:hypothetical protein
MSKTRDYNNIKLNQLNQIYGNKKRSRRSIRKGFFAQR